MSSYTADRQGHVYKNDSGQDRLLEKMYGCAPGRAVLTPLVNPVLSELGGRILDSRLSALAVPAFIRHAGIDMRDYEKKKFRLNEAKPLVYSHGEYLGVGKTLGTFGYSVKKKKKTSRKKH